MESVDITKNLSETFYTKIINIMKSKEKNISDLSKRFLYAIEAKGYTGYKLAKEVTEITQSKLTFIRNGRNKPSEEVINALLKKFPDISEVWLKTGKGNIFDLENINPENSNDMDLLSENNRQRELIELLKDQIKKKDDQLQSQDQQIKELWKLIKGDKPKSKDQLGA